MDAIESGIVKLPRVPIIANDQGNTTTFRNLFDRMGKIIIRSSFASFGSSATRSIRFRSAS
jgi:hypothetical protein